MAVGSNGLMKAIEEACKFVLKIRNDRAVHHVHLYGAGVRALGSLEEVMALELDQKDATCIRINCAKFDNVKLMQDEIDTECSRFAESSFLQKPTLVLLRAEEMCRFEVEHLRMLFNQLKKEKATLIVTVSYRSWEKIESQGFRVALSSPLQYHIPQSGVQD